MDNQSIIFITFVVYLLMMFVVGWKAWCNTHNFSDYILGSRRLGSWTTAISAGASDMSGWLLLGLPGYAYLAGLDMIYLSSGVTPSIEESRENPLEYITRTIKKYHTVRNGEKISSRGSSCLFGADSKAKGRVCQRSRPCDGNPA